ESDWMVPSFRETAAMLWRGWPIEKLLMTFAGQLEGCQPAPEQHDLPITIPVGTQLPHAVGLAYAAQYRGDDVVVMAYFGDGATSEGDFHEALNFAGVWHVPVVFVCQNNQWAISVPLKKQTHSRTIAQKALAYGLPGLQVDGNDVLAVYAATKEAVDRAREGNGPTLIECVTYRLGVHTTADDPTKYRSEEEVREWERKDPLTRFVEYLRKKNLLEDGLVFGVTEDLHRKFGGKRVIDSPLAESAIIGTSVGMALYGLKPVCEIQFSGFAFQCFHQIENHAARYRMRTQGRFHCQMVVR